MKRTSIIIFIVVLALVVGGGIGYFFNFQSNNYISTQDARVAADMLPITPPITGSVTSWTVKTGDLVTQGQVIGRQDTSIVTASNPALSSSPATLDAMSQIKAPIDGKIIQSSAIKGQMASPATNLAVVANMSNAYISANIKETNIQNIAAGQKVDITIDAYPNTIFLGAVSSIGQATSSTFSLLPAQNASGSYTKVTQVIPVRITINDIKGVNLMPGMNASVKIYVR
jgi:multidrug resistance efflux pump